MNFDFTETEQAFAEEVRRFLRANPPETFSIDGMDAGYGSGAHSRAFLRALGAQGWLSMCWPKAHGGGDQPMFMKLVLMEELALAGAPFGPLPGCWQTADAIIEYGTERLRREVLPAIARVLRQLVDYANTTPGGGAPLAHDPFVRRRLAAIAAEIAALRLMFYRTGCLIRDGAPLTYETAMAKVYADETGQKLARLGMDLLGVWGPLREGSRWAKLGGQISHLYLTTLGHTIAGGTAEILRSSVAVRGLGLSPEPKTAA